MPFLLKAAGTLLLLVSLNAPFLAQSPKPKPTARVRTPERSEAAAVGSTGEKTLTLHQQHALGLLDQLFDQAKEFSDAQAKIRIQAQIDDLLWGYHEPRARRQFEAAFQASNSLTISTLSGK